MKRLLLSTLFLSAISGTALAGSTVKSCDRQVYFEEPPKAAISHDVNLTEMMLVLGLSKRMLGYTGISGWKTLDEQMRKNIGRLPELSAKYPTKEVILEAGADFFFAGWNYGMKVGGEVTPETLEPLGVKVYELTESCIHIGEKAKVSMDDMYNDLLNLGKIFGVEEKARSLVEGYKAELEDFTTKLDRGNRALRVFVFDNGGSGSGPFTAGRYAMPTALIEAAGGRNVVDNVEKSWTNVSWEAVVEQNPEVIVIVNYGDVTAGQKRELLMSNPALANVDAVKNDRFVVLEYVEATPGPRNIKAVKKLANGFWK